MHKYLYGQQKALPKSARKADYIHWLKAHWRYAERAGEGGYQNKIKFWDVRFKSQEQEDAAWKAYAEGCETGWSQAFADFEAVLESFKDEHPQSEIAREGRMGGHAVLMRQRPGYNPAYENDSAEDIDAMRLPELKARYAYIRAFDVICEKAVKAFCEASEDK